MKNTERYTTWLEAEVDRLEDENKALKDQLIKAKAKKVSVAKPKAETAAEVK